MVFLCLLGDDHGATGARQAGRAARTIVEPVARPATDDGPPFRWSQARAAAVILTLEAAVSGLAAVTAGWGSEARTAPRWAGRMPGRCRRRRRRRLPRAPAAPSAPLPPAVNGR